MGVLPEKDDFERRVDERTAELTAALRGSEARFRALIENSLDVVAIVGADAAVRYISPSVERILGYSAEERTGANSFDFVHPDDAEGLRAVFELATKDPGAMADIIARVIQQHSAPRAGFYFFRTTWLSPTVIAAMAHSLQANHPDLAAQIVAPRPFFDLYKQAKPK